MWGAAYAAGVSPVTDARPAARRVRITGGHQRVGASLREAWQARELCYRFALRDLTLRYRQTVLGVAWVVIQPLLAAGAFSLVFGKVASLPSGGVTYVTFAFAGLLGWTAFSGTVTKSSASLLMNATMVSKVFFPRLLLPLSTLAAALVDFLVGLVLFLLLALVTGPSPDLHVLALPGILALLLAAGLGIGFAASAAATMFRDVTYVVNAGVPLLLYASPVAYSLEAVPEGARPFFYANPLTGSFELLRWSLVGGPLPSAGLVGYSVAAAVALLVAGALLFLRLEKDLADVI